LTSTRGPRMMVGLADDGLAQICLDHLARLPRSDSGVVGVALELRKPLTVTVVVVERGGRLTKRTQHQFHGRHVVAQVRTFRHDLVLLVRLHREVEGSRADLIREDRIFDALLRAAIAPFVGQFVARQIVPNPRLDPRFSMPARPVQLADALDGGLWVLDLFQALVADLGQPEAKWLRAG